MKRLQFLALVMLTAPLAAAAAPARPMATTLPSPTLVTLHLRDADPETAFADLFAQAHVSMMQMDLWGLHRSAGQRVTLDMENRPFLEALLELCRRTAMEPNESSMTASGIGLVSRLPRQGGPGGPATLPWPSSRFLRSRRLTSTTQSVTTTRASATTRRSWVDLPSATTGPFVFIPRDIERRHWMDLSGQDGGEFTHLWIVTLLDPNVRLHSAAMSMEVVEATDEHGNSLLPDKPSPIEVETRWDSGNWLWMSAARFAYPPLDSRMLATLKLRFHGAIVTRTERIEIADLDRADGAIRAQHGLRYRLERPRGNDRGIVVPLTVYRDGRDDEQWKELRMMMRDERSMRITDERERPVRIDNYITESPDHQAMAIELRIPRTVQPATNPATTTAATSRCFAATRPVRMVWTLAVEVQDVAVPVEFRNLRLP